MRIRVKLFATLREGRFDATERELPPGATVDDLLAQLGIESDQATLRLLNGRHAELNSELHDDDVLALFPPIGGG